MEKGGLFLTRQDRRRLRPHVTLQNKVGTELAQRTLRAVEEEFEGREGRAEGVRLWRYEVGGKWSFLDDWAFRGKEEVD